MKKAEKIFKDTYFECKQRVKDWGVEYNPNGSMIAFATLITEETVSTRTLNAVQKYIDNEKFQLDMFDKYCSETEEQKERHLVWRQALQMVQETLNNHRKHNKEWEEFLKA